MRNINWNCMCVCISHIIKIYKIENVRVKIGGESIVFYETFPYWMWTFKTHFRGVVYVYEEDEFQATASQRRAIENKIHHFYTVFRKKTPCLNSNFPSTIRYFVVVPVKIHFCDHQPSLVVVVPLQAHSKCARVVHEKYKKKKNRGVWQSNPRNSYKL